MRRIQTRLLLVILIGFACCSSTLVSGQENPLSNQIDGVDGVEFFESQVQPILEQHCSKCHADDPAKLGGGLALVSRKSILHGGDSGPAVDLENADKSLLIQAIRYDALEMPPSGKLSDEEIAILTKWVAAGIPWTAETADRMIETSKHEVPQVNQQSKSFWSFQKVRPVEAPAVENEEWVANDIDRFVLSRLEREGLEPARPASRRALVRRLYYDLTGLPPTPDQVDEFVNDSQESSYQELIEGLLASPHYGEKWGRHWLDLVRYAESNSFERDGTKPFVWRYRDYVIRSFNDDKPYSQFLLEQLAGDELDEPTAESIIATGYYRLGQWDDEPADRKQALYDDLDDILATTSQVMMGLTINCARCHDHKIDPIPTKDYYRMLAFFRNVKRYGDRTHETVLKNSTRLLANAIEPSVNEMVAFEKKIKSHEAAIKEVFEIAKKDFKPVDHEDFLYKENHERLLHERLKNNTISQKQFDQFVRARNDIRALVENPPDKYRVLCVKEHANEPLETHVLIRGSPHSEGEKVRPGFVSVLSPPEPEFAPFKPGDKSSGRRLALARWISSSDHPLTARVMVNRIWQHHFGRGIVRTASDFGFQGEKPTHPQLLDYLANEFVMGGWSIKNMHRLILNSNAYRMSSQFNAAAYEKDPLNESFWRFDMRRLTSEEVRDSILAVSGRLNRNKMYGPSIFAKLSQEVLAGQSMPGNGWGDSAELDTRRRSIYIHVKRSLRVPLLEAFDSADTDFTCPVRFNTAQPSQALALLNSEFVNQEARQFAKMVFANHDSPEKQVAEILNRILQRKPTEEDVRQGIALMDSLVDEEEVSVQKALELFCLTAFNLNEFVFLE